MISKFLTTREKPVLKITGAVALATLMLVGGYTGARAEDLKSWYGSVAQTIAKKQTYPRAAMQKEIQGKAKVKVTVAPDGTVGNFEVVQASGQAVLDDEIPSLMKRISPLPKPPADAQPSDLSFVVPLNWTLE